MAGTANSHDEGYVLEDKWETQDDHPDLFYFKLKWRSITLLGTLEDPRENLINLLYLNDGFSNDWLVKLGKIIQLLQTPVPESKIGEHIYFFFFKLKYS